MNFVYENRDFTRNREYNFDMFFILILNFFLQPLCSNHDDGKTLAVMLCNICGLLCLDCDRFLHLNKKTTNHERRVSIYLKFLKNYLY